MLGPAVDGTLRVLKAAKKNGVKRVVLTSSTVAIMGGKKTGTITPEDWTDLNSKNISTYFKSKTLAEKAAWFCYEYWLDEKLRPDFANTIDIHRKPGYDPCELFMSSKLNVARRILQKNLGFRTRFDMTKVAF